MAESGNGKAFGGVIAIVAIIAGVYAMVEPMGTRMDVISNTVGKMEERMIKDDDRERNDAGIFAKTLERVRALERSVYGKPLSCADDTD